MNQPVEYVARRKSDWDVTQFRTDHIRQEELEMEAGGNILVVDNNNFLRIVFSRKSTAVDEVISKPFTLERIDETIHNFLGKALCA